MKPQSKTRINQLLKQYPVIQAAYEMYSRYRDDDGKRLQTTIGIVVQRPDPELMGRQGRGLLPDGRTHVCHEDGVLRGTGIETLAALGKNGLIMGALSWADNPGDREKRVADIFRKVDPDKVATLIWESVICWHEPATEQEETETGLLFGKRVGIEQQVIIYPRLKHMPWKDLMEIADRQKKEREEAYLKHPKCMPNLLGIELALERGCQVHAFLSGGGLRVVSITKDGGEVGYGEHPHVEEALNHADEDFIAGNRPYDSVYGSKGRYPHYLTGSTEPTSNLDSWVRRGYTFDCWQEGEVIVFQLQGYSQFQLPDNVTELAKTQPGRPVKWRKRGFTFKTTYRKHLCANGDPGYTCDIVKYPKDRPNASPFSYQVTKTGKGPTFWRAMKAAFRAREKEVIWIIR